MAKLNYVMLVFNGIFTCYSFFLINTCPFCRNTNGFSTRDCITPISSCGISCSCKICWSYFHHIILISVFNKDLQKEARFVRKQSAQLASKMRYLSCQFTAYLTDELWLKNATHANVMAAKLYKELKKLPEVTFTQKVESNQLFLTMPRPIIDRMLESYFFYFWNEDKDEIRLVTSFDTTEEDVDEFIRLLKR